MGRRKKNTRKQELEQELKKWGEQIAEFGQLKINEAQALYKKATSTTDKELKRMYMDKLILGTLYIPYNYIKRNNLLLLCSSTNDINDIINTMNELWIKKIYAGELVGVSRFSLLFDTTFFYETCDNMLGNNIHIKNQFAIREEYFTELFSYYIELKNQNKSFNYTHLLEKYCKNHKIKIKSKMINCDENIMVLFEKIYQELNFDKLDDLKMSPTQISNFIKVLINLGMTDTLSENLPAEDMISKIVEQETFKEFFGEFDTILKEGEIKILYQRFGLDGKEPQTLKKIGDNLHITQENVRQKEAKALSKLRHSRKVKEYKCLW